jgi:glycosyltransferase involved in cell wall biosynthesis
VGSLSRRKNVQGIVSAAEILLKRFRSLKCVFVGGQAKVLAENDFGTDASVVDRLVFVGQIDSTSELFRYYRHASCFVFPSFYEASPMPPTEAMSAGCPVVASAIPPHHERLRDAALYCQPRDANDIARKVAMVLEDAGVRDGLIAKGLKRASEFAWDRAALETLRIIDDVVRTDPAFNRAA